MSDRPVHWTAAEIRTKADALAGRGGGRITLAAETVGLIVAALRFYATEGLAERRDAFTVDVWNARGTVIEHVGSLSNRAAAQAAFDAACVAHPEPEVTLRQGIRIVIRREARVRPPS